MRILKAVLAIRHAPHGAVVACDMARPDRSHALLRRPQEALGLDRKRMIKCTPFVAGIMERGLALCHIATGDITVCNTYVDNTDLRDDDRRSGWYTDLGAT